MSTTIKVGVVWLLGYILAFFLPIALLSQFTIVVSFASVVSGLLIALALGFTISVVCAVITLGILEDK